MHRLSYPPPLWSGLHALNQLFLDAIKIMIAIVAKLMPKSIGVILAARSHDWVIELFERIELRGRYQTAGSAARPEKPCGYRFRHTHKGFYRVSNLVCRDKLGLDISLCWATSMREIGMTPFRQLARAAVLDPFFNRIEQRNGQAIRATPFCRVYACQFVELLMPHARRAIGLWPLCSTPKEAFPHAVRHTFSCTAS